MISVRKFILFVILITVLGTGRSLLLAQGVIPDPPHWGNGINCPSCHVSYQEPDVSISNLKGNSNLCMSCHNLVSIANDKPFSNAGRAVPGISGTSHAWDVPALNDTFGAALPTEQELLDHVYSNHVTWSTCHNPHRQTYPPFLRVLNFQDALCKDCHAVRAVGLFRDSPDNKGSHPVGITYPTSDSRFFMAPLDTVLSLIDSTRVECTTCHSLHYADSGGANDGAGDGYILRAANNGSLCQACHTYQSHIGQGCLKCHQPHDPARTNIFLVKGNVLIPNQGEQPVVFSAETGANSFADGDGMYNGICEVCHTSTNHHRNDGTAPGDFSQDGTYIGHFNEQNCTACHAHSDAFRPAGANVPPPHTNFACEVCHTSPDTYVPNAPIPNAACMTCYVEGVIKTHFSHYTDPTTGQTVNLNCVECHNPMSVQKNFRGNENLYFIRNKIRNHEVVFEAQTGPIVLPMIYPIVLPT